MSEARKGRPSYFRTEEWRKRQSEALKGRPKGTKGRKMTDEQRKRMSEGGRRNPGNRGKTKPSKETVAKSKEGKRKARSKRNVVVGDRGRSGNLLGVTLVKNRYSAQIGVNNKNVSLGVYDTEMGAHLAYVSYFNQFIKEQTQIDLGDDNVNS
jgi:hypothetical protein